MKFDREYFGASVLLLIITSFWLVFLLGFDFNTLIVTAVMFITGLGLSYYVSSSRDY